MSFITFPARIEGSNFRNTGIGFNSLLRVTPAPTTGNANTAYGYNALTFTTTGRFNTAIGSQALEANSTGSSNTAVGDYPLQNNVSGSFNTAVGRGALSSTDSIGSTGVGANSLLSATGGGNTAIGYGAGSLITTGQNNTVLGPFSGNQGGYDIRTLNNYVVIADGDGNPRIIVDPAGLVSAPGGFSGGGGGGAITFNNQTAAYTVVSGDLGKIVNCTAGTFTVSLTAAATLGSGFNCWVWNTSTTSSDAITINPNGSETIDGKTTLVLRRGEGMQIVCDGTNWQTGDKKVMRGYAENYSGATNRPIATGDYSVAVGEHATSTTQATDTYALAIYGSATAPRSVAIGQNSFSQLATTAAGSGAMALGGSYASGTDSFAAGVANNTSTYGATGANSVALGYRAKASSSGSVALGYNSASTGSNSTAIGSDSTASGGYGTTINGISATDGGIWSKLAIGSGFSSAGQTGILQLRELTADATATVLKSNGAAAGAANQCILPNNSAHAFTGTIVARQQAAGGTQSAAWTVSGLIRREANAASTTLVASTVTVISNVPGWTLALSADTTNGGLAVTATGAAATNIKWLANIQTTEVTYA